MLEVVHSREEAMLYLWRIHNGVNKRLSQFNNNGNDPFFPKVSVKNVASPQQLNRKLKVNCTVICER